MKIAVLGGGGAMGGFFGGSLAEAGYDTVLVDVSAPAVDAINSTGLHIEERNGSARTVRVAASRDPASVGQVDLILNFVKSYHTAEAIRSAGPMIGPETSILSLQNGWGNAARIAEVVGERRVLVGLTYHAAMLLGPGRIRHPATGATYVGEINGETSERLTSIVDALGRAGLEVTASEHILEEVWKKLALNASTLPIATILRLFAHELLQHDGTIKLMRGLLDEVVAVATSQDIVLDHDERWKTITGILERAVGGKGSMLQDVEAGRRTEIDVINGAIVEAGQRSGVPTPLNAAMVWLVNSIQEAYLAEAKG